MGIGELQARGDRLGGFSFPGPGGAAQQKVTHRLCGSCCLLNVLADADNLLRDHIPFGKLRDHRLFLCCERAVCKSIFANEIRVLRDHSRSGRRSAGGQDLEVTIQNLGGRVGAFRKIDRSKRRNIPRGGDGSFDAGRAEVAGVFDPPVQVVAQDIAAPRRFFQIGIARFFLSEQVPVLCLEFIVFQRQRHQRKKEGGSAVLISLQYVLLGRVPRRCKLACAEPAG